MDIDKRATELALHLLDVETKSKVRKNKRSISDIEYILNEMDEHSNWTARNPL